MNDIKDVRFFSGGRAVFTVDNGKGTHYTYRIARNEDTQPFFVGLLTGQNNDSDYTYMGLYQPDNNSIRLTQKSKYKEDSQPVKVIQWAIKQIATGKELPSGYSIQHEGRCCKCGRTLTTPESCLSGIGPICAEKEGWGLDTN